MLGSTTLIQVVKYFNGIVSICNRCIHNPRKVIKYVYIEERLVEEIGVMTLLLQLPHTKGHLPTFTDY